MNAARAIRIAGVAVLVLGIEWRLADPAAIASDPERFSVPWAMLAVMFPIAIGLWAFEANNVGGRDFRLDTLWGVFVGTIVYSALAILG